MGTRSLIYLAVGFFCAALASSVSARTIDFESLSTGPMAPNGLDDYGISSVTYSGGTGPLVYDYGSEPDIQAPSPTKVFFPSGGSFPSPSGFFDTTLTFATPMEYFQFSKIAEVNAPYTYGIAGWRARAFDSGNVMIDEVEENLAGGIDFPSPLPNEVYLLEGINRIKTVVFTVNYNFQSTAGTVGVDDFTFRVPEPHSLVLLGLGLAAIIARRPRRPIA